MGGSGRTELHSLQQLAATAQQGWEQGAQPPCVASGEKQDKAQASAHLTAWQEDREKCDTNTNPSSAAEESTASQISVLQVVSLQFIEKSWVCLRKMGQKLCSLNAKKEKGFSSSEAIVPSLPAGLGPTTAPSTTPPWDQGCSRVCRAQPTQQELGKN